MSEMNNSATETQELSDEQKFFNLLDSSDATPAEDERAEQVEDATEEVDEDVDESEVESEEVVEEDSSETEPNVEDTEDEYIFNVSIDGEDTEVNHNELIQGYQRQSDYTRKTQSLAEDRKVFEEQQAQLTQERQELLTMLQQQQTSANSELDKFKDINWSELKEYEPDKYLMLREEQREVQSQVQTQSEEHGRLAQAQQQEYQVQFQRYLVEEDAKLVDQIEGWGNPETKKNVQNDIASYAKQIGYTDDELGNIADSRALLLMHKARLYDEMQGTTKKLVTKKKAKAVRKVVKSGKPISRSQNESKRVADLRVRAKQTGSVDDAAAAFLEMF